FSDIKGQPDLCVFWFRKAFDSTATRGGLVATNSIAQNVSRTASLDYILNNGGKIINAISTQVWSGDANVHVSIVNWVKDGSNYKGSFLLDSIEVPTINSSLKPENNFTSALKIDSNANLSFEGIQLAGKGFVISKE